ncbi:hypothetical protein ACFUMH_12710 [Cellulomonas sp. NPDC057328]|uniref:hypothetical protein n=1 Tax=Cellulomonas sp. NPDC057328 TaxID=3346101 RepID=UPI003631DD15
MESHPTTPDPRDASALLGDLERDRTALAPHAATPDWALVAASALAAAYVALPLAGDGRSPVLLMIGAGALALVVQLRQRRLVRRRRRGVAASMPLLGLLAVVLLLLSVSFGLVAADLHLLVAVPALAAGLCTYALLRRSDARERRDLDRVG